MNKDYYTIGKIYRKFIKTEYVLTDKELKEQIQTLKDVIQYFDGRKDKVCYPLIRDLYTLKNIQNVRNNHI